MFCFFRHIGVFLLRNKYFICSLYGNNVTIRFCFFVIVMCFLFRHNYVIYLFDLITFFDNVRITLYFGTFELLTETVL